MGRLNSDLNLDALLIRSRSAHRNTGSEAEPINSDQFVVVDDRMWNFDIRPKPKRSAKNRSIRPNIRPNISILINQVFEHLTKNFSRHNFTLTFFMY